MTSPHPRQSPRHGLSFFTLVAALFLAATTYAQTDTQKLPDGYVGVVTSDNVYVRSGAADSYYPFGKVHQNNLVLVTDEKYNWAQIAAVGPAFHELFGYVRYNKDETGKLRVSPDGKTATTLGRMEVLAPNLNTGSKPSDSWKPIARLDADQPLRILETTESNDKIIHKVVLPTAATGWVSMAYVRKANDQEKLEWRRQLAAGPAKRDVVAAAKSVEPKAETKTVPGAKPVVKPGAKQVERDTAPKTPNVKPVVAAKPQAKPATYQPESIFTSRVSTEQRNDMPTNFVELTPEQLAARREAEARRPKAVVMGREEPRNIPTVSANAGASTDSIAERISRRSAEQVERDRVRDEARERLLDLETKFEMLDSEPIETAEVAPLRSLYLQLADDHPDQEKTVRFALAQAEQLEVWRELQQRKQDLRALRSRMELHTADTESARIALAQAGTYVAVGRLEASTIYDGVQLPQLLRIQDEGSGRTLAYLRPDGEFHLVEMLGQIIGVVGEKEYDGTVQVHLITPQRIDVLNPTRESAGM